MGSNELFRQRDYLIVFVVIATSCVLLFDRPSLEFSLVPAWYIDQRAGKTNPVSTLDLRLVPPILTDLDGDGSKEFVVITKDLQLKIYSAEVSDATEGNGEIYHPEILASTRLNQNEIMKGRAPIALTTGYIEPYIESKARTEVIVVLREDWTISAYDSLLNLLWEKPIEHKAHELLNLIENYEISDISVNVYPISLSEEEGSYGVIVVGASMAPRKAGIGGKGKLMNPPADKNTVVDRAKAELEHFSIYTLNANNGDIIWCHDGLDVKAEQYSKSLPKYAFSLNIRDLITQSHHAAGLSDWTIFRQSLIDELPHYWGQPQDTASRMAHFVRRHMGAGAGQQVDKGPVTGDMASKTALEMSKRNKQKQHNDITAGKGRNGKTSLIRKLSQPDAQAQGGGGGGGGGGIPASTSTNGKRVYGKAKRPPPGHLLDAITFKAVSDAASLPHAAIEHTVAPNVLVAHTKSGLEVISLRLGTPITSIALDRGKTYADVNGDGSIDAVLVLSDEESVRRHGTEFQGIAIQHPASKQGLKSQSMAAGQGLGCTMVVVSGMPAQAQLFNGSVCQHKGLFTDQMTMDNLHRGHAARSMPLQVSATPPLVLRKIDHTTMRESKYRDIFVAINTGVLSSFAGDGDLNWQVSGTPTWTLVGVHDTDGEEDSAIIAGHNETDSEGDSVQAKRESKAKQWQKKKQQQTGAYKDGFGQARVMAFDHDALRVEESGSHSSPDAEGLLVIGESQMQLRSRTHGAILASTDIPNPPVGTPVLGDFDNDGVIDVIVVTDDAILGYRLHVVQYTPGLLVAVILLSLFAIVVFIASIEKVVLVEGGGSRGVGGGVGDGGGRVGVGGAGKKGQGRGTGVLQVVRSTDDHHLD